MNPLIKVFNLIFYQPLFNALIFLYQYLSGHDFGIAIIFLTILIRLILFPLSIRSLKSQKALNEIGPKIREIQEKYKNDREKQTGELISLYQKEKINPFSGFLSLFIQLPILIALYQVFWKGFLPEAMTNLYGFVPHPGKINPYFLGLINLSNPNLVLATFAGIFQFFQIKMLNPKIQKTKEKDVISQYSEIFQKQFLYFFSFLTILILIRLPSALSLYWLVTTLFSILQQSYVR